MSLSSFTWERRWWAVLNIDWLHDGTLLVLESREILYIVCRKMKCLCKNRVSREAEWKYFEMNMFPDYDENFKINYVYNMNELDLLIAILISS